MADARPSFCYVVSHFSDAGHTAHLSRFLERVADSVDVHVVVWSHDVVPSFAGVKEVHLLRDRAANRFLRMVALVRLARSLSKRGCRVFYVRIAHHVGAVLGLLRKPLGLRVLQWHSGMAKESKPPWRFQPGSLVRRVRWSLNDLLLGLSFRLVTTVVTGPQSMAAYYRTRYRVPAGKIRVLPNELDVAAVRALSSSPKEQEEIRTRLGIPRDGRLLLYSGGLSAFRLGEGGHSFRDPLHLILEAHHGVHLVVAGERGLPAIERWSSRSAYKDRIHLLGPVPFREVATLAAASEVFVFPVVAAGFPRVLLEAMALDLPFVAYDVGGVRDVAGEALKDHIVQSDSPDRFAAAVAELLASETLRRSAIESGQERVKRYDVGLVCEEFLELLEL